MNNLEQMLWKVFNHMYSEEDMENLDTGNFLNEMRTIDGSSGKAEDYHRFAAENPDDPISGIAELMGNYQFVKPYLVWDWKRVAEISQVIFPLRDAIRKIDNEAEFSVQLEGMLEEDIIVVVRSGQYNEWRISADDQNLFSDLLEKIDEIVIAPILNERFEVWFTLKGARTEA